MTGSGKRDSMSGTEHLGVLFLAAGYGTRLQRDIAAAPHLSRLHDVPKPLLPINGKPILSHWISAISAIPALASVVVITNAAHFGMYQDWAVEARTTGIPIHVESDGSVDNASRLGAVKDISLGLAALQKTRADKALIIAGDTLLQGVDMVDYVSQFAEGKVDAATFAYPLADMSDCVRRGMFKVRQEPSGELLATEVVEKPSTLEDSPSNLASAPVYMLRKSLWRTLDEFLSECQAENVSLEKRDAPGFWLGWLVKKFPCRLFRVHKRVDIGGLSHYMDALWEFSLPREETNYLNQRRASSEPAIGRGYPRIGLLGNPSDGYGGKVIAISVASEGFAQVVATPSEKFVVNVNPTHELRSEFESLNDLEQHVSEHGLHFSARTLVLAAAVMFAREYQRFAINQHSKEGEQGSVSNGCAKPIPNCQLTYSTSIPARIGLSGSSALILATLRSLARFYHTSLEEINGNLEAWPNLMRSAEADMLGIPCGLQDRVVQVMQGCVAMDFSSWKEEDKSHSTRTGENPRWVRLPEDSLPEMYVAYYSCGHAGECSGKVHGNLKSRFAAQDPAVLNAVKRLCSIADEGRVLLEQRAKDPSSDMSMFPHLVNQNFEQRLALVGRDSIGKHNTHLVDVARQAGFAAKMTGSGGCALCVPDPIRDLSDEELQSAKSLFEQNDMVMRKVVVLERRDWRVRTGGS